MSPFRPIAAVLLSATIFAKGSAGAAEQQRGTAKISIVKLSQAMNFDHKNLIAVSLEDCAIRINGTDVALKEGDYKEFHASKHLVLSPASETNPRLVLVEAVAPSQALTIQTWNLAAHQEFEDASDRNQTLLVALEAFQITDERDLAPEGEPWKSSRSRLVQLHGGETTWLKPGMHRVRNAGDTVARFLTIEW